MPEPQGSVVLTVAERNVIKDGLDLLSKSIGRALSAARNDQFRALYRAELDGIKSIVVKL